jgi:hypothetical protein
VGDVNAVEVPDHTDELLEVGPAGLRDEPPSFGYVLKELTSFSQFENQHRSPLLRVAV